MPEYKQAFKRPFTDLGKFIVGCLMYMIPFVNIITGFLATGYILRCGKRAMVNDYRLPIWNDWEDLFLKGLVATIISFIYMIPALVLGYLFGGEELVLAVLMFEAPAELSANLLIPLVFMLLAGYMIPYALMRFVDHERFSSAFAILDIAEKTFTLRYLAPWLVTFLYGTVIFTVAYIINFYLSFTIVAPFIVTAIALFIQGATVMSIFGGIYKELGRVYYKF